MPYHYFGSSSLGEVWSVAAHPCINIGNSFSFSSLLESNLNISITESLYLKPETTSEEEYKYKNTNFQKQMKIQTFKSLDRNLTAFDQI